MGGIDCSIRVNDNVCYGSLAVIAVSSKGISLSHINRYSKIYCTFVYTTADALFCGYHGKYLFFFLCG